MEPLAADAGPTIPTAAVASTQSKRRGFVHRIRDSLQTDKKLILVTICRLGLMTVVIIPLRATKAETKRRRAPRRDAPLPGSYRPGAALRRSTLAACSTLESGCPTASVTWMASAEPPWP